MIVYRCRVCGYVLYVVRRVGQDSYGVPTPSEVIRMYGGVCPRCGHRLGRPGPGDVTVAPRQAEDEQTAVTTEAWVRGPGVAIRRPPSAQRAVIRVASGT